MWLIGLRFVRVDLFGALLETPPLIVLEETHQISISKQVE